MALDRSSLGLILSARVENMTQRDLKLGACFGCFTQSGSLERDALGYGRLMFGQRWRVVSRLVWVCGVNVLGSAGCGGQSEDGERSAAAASASDFDAGDGETQSEGRNETQRKEPSEGDDGSAAAETESAAENSGAGNSGAEGSGAEGAGETQPEPARASERGEPAPEGDAGDDVADDAADADAAELTTADGDEASGETQNTPSSEDDVSEPQEMNTAPDDAAELDEPADVDVEAPTSPPTLDDIVISSGDVAHPLCDLGGGVPVVKACVAMPNDTDCSSLDFNLDDVMDIANDNYHCGHPWVAGIICGPALEDTSDVNECCWEMDGHCLEDQMLPSNPRELHPGDSDTLPAGCTGEGSEDMPNFPVESGDFFVEPGDRDAPLCDLGGGIPRTRVCAPLISNMEGCHDLIVDTNTIFSAARQSRTCDESWTPGIVCGPVHAEFESGPACCWELDGVGLQ